jgi:23S rRNA pseudouridine2605 synthase
MTPYPPPVRLNRYLSAAGLGNRREVEGYVAAGQVAVAGAVATDPSRRVEAGEEVLVNGTPLVVRPAAVVALHKPPGRPALLVHPPGLVSAVPLTHDAAGLELLVGDPALAQRVADPRFPAPALWRDGRRTRVAGVDLGDLREGEWRALPPRDVERLRRSLRLPPRA